MNNSESDGNNNINNTDIELNNLYNRYFKRPENIDAVYNKPIADVYYAGHIGGYVYDKTNINMYQTEKIIRGMYYRLPNLMLPEFFDIKQIRTDLLAERKQEISEIFDAMNMILSDIDKIKDIKTKKRILYYFKCLTIKIKNSDFAKDVSVLVAKAAIRNNLATPKDLQVFAADKNMKIAVVTRQKDNNR